MRWLLIKLGLFLCVWYEVSAELGIGGGTAFAMTLLVCGAGLMLLRLPGQVLSILGPPAVLVIGPVVVWAGLAWWLMPGVFPAYPVLTLIAALVLALTGAATKYAVSRYPSWFARRWLMLRGLMSPLGMILVELADQWRMSPLSLAAVIVLVGMPLRLGWRFIPPLSPHKFDAKMGDGESFRRAGFSDEA